MKGSVGNESAGNGMCGIHRKPSHREIIGEGLSGLWN